MKDPISCLVEFPGSHEFSWFYVVVLFLSKKFQCAPVMDVYSYAVSAYSINIVCVLRIHCLFSGSLLSSYGC